MTAEDTKAILTLGTNGGQRRDVPRPRDGVTARTEARGGLWRFRLEPSELAARRRRCRCIPCGGASAVQTPRQSARGGSYAQGSRPRRLR